MDVHKQLDDLIDMVDGARSMPMSASCVVNRSEMLAALEELRAALPEEISMAQRVLAERDAVIDEGRSEADRIIEHARRERGSLVSGTSVARESQGEADRILADARREAEELRREADDYVDSKLANFEVVLTKTLNAVGRGREKLLGKRPSDELGAYMAAADAEAERAQRDADGYGDGPASGEFRLDGRPEEGEYAEDGFPSGEYPSSGAGYDTSGGGYQVPQGDGGYGGEQQQPYPTQDGYPAYAQQDSYAAGYETQGGYPGEAAPAAGYPGQVPAQAPAGYAGAGLDETSFFDTSVIDVERLRELGNR